MISLASWNIRGLNRTPKQEEIIDVVSRNRLCMCDVLESHVNIKKLADICNKVFSNWRWTSNNSACESGNRIILGWNPGIIDVMEGSLEGSGCSVKDGPWVMLDDFNAPLYVADSSVGSSNITISMREFKECVDKLRMSDVNRMGMRFTWNQKPNAPDGLLRKIDRVMTNDSFIHKYASPYAVFQPYRISHHCPAVLKIPTNCKYRPRPFMFSNFITFNDEFQATMFQGWRQHMNGCSMFKVIKKTKNDEALNA
ncbi:uncharacterized protein [Rutidosis leptorrhynchoides]|uniref:uncharacterized protein n=1 Tax=Rutidosis leptorrhynchoides TaxID=125765 RepID=UPI003A98F314